MGRTFSRRELLGNAARFGAGALAAGTLTDPARLARLLADQETTKRLRANTSGPAPGPLVLCTMYGGYDGMNVVVPYQNAAYIAARPTMSDAVTAQDLSGAPGLALHPAMTGMYALWNANKVAILQGVGIPNPNYSHFSSMAQQMAGTTDLTVATGWAGRWLDGLSGNALTALSVGGVIPQLLLGNTYQASGVTDTDVSANQSVPGGAAFQTSYNAAQNASAYSGLQAGVAMSGANLVDVATEATSALATEAPLSVAGRNGGDFGQQLSIIGQLILAGAPTQVYQASMGGFDTHSNELNAQQSLFAQLDAAVTAFFNGLGSDSSVAPVLLIYTEFGRQLRENGSIGTDHGNGNTWFVIGPTVKGGLYGTYPSLTTLDGAGALIQNVDYRQVEAELIDSVLGGNSTTILGGTYSHLGFI